MPRRSREGLFDTLVQLPWPAGVVAGLIGFVAIRWGVALVFASTGGQFGASMAKAFSSGALAPFAWIFLAVCLVASGLSYWRSESRVKLLDSQANLDSIRSLSWRQFEQLVGEAFRRRGYRIEETGQDGADGGVDLLLTKDGETTLVQCKHWRSRHVGVSVVREMFGLMEHHRAVGGKIVCTGTISAECFRFAVGKPIELIDGEALHRLVEEVRADASFIERQSASPEAVIVPVPPPCPKCASPMVERSNRTTGQRFWGCPRFPGCRGTVAS